MCKGRLDTPTQCPLPNGTTLRCQRLGVRRHTIAARRTAYSAAIDLCRIEGAAAKAPGLTYWTFAQFSHVPTSTEPRQAGGIRQSTSEWHGCLDLLGFRFPALATM
jgi:hypothetical protein